MFSKLIFRLVCFNCIVLIAAIDGQIVSKRCRSSYKGYHGNHTSCKGRSQECKVIKSGLSSTDVALILSTHNELRNRIAGGNETVNGFPSSANMMQLEWSQELADIAQDHAYQCQFAHDCYSCRQSDEFEVVGQNLFLLRTSRVTVEPRWQMVIAMWYDELKIAPKSVVSYFQSHGVNIGHFTQISWAATHKVGCGFVAYLVRGSIYRVAHLYTCNYGPGGNYIGLQMYKEGNPASDCPLGSRPSFRFKALCRSSKMSKSANLPKDNKAPHKKNPVTFKRKRKILTQRKRTSLLRNSKVTIRKIKRKSYQKMPRIVGKKTNSTE